MSKHVRNILGRGQRGFTLIELVAVMAIMAVLAGIVAGAVGGLGASGQSARLASDRDSIGKAVDRFYNDAYPQAYPAAYDADLKGLARDGISIPKALASQVIDWDSRLPQDPTKKFVPGYLKDIPDSAALVSWRLDSRTASVFFADDAALLIPPSTATLSVAVAAGSTATIALPSIYTFTIGLNKYEAAQQVLTIAIPEGYGIAQPTTVQIGSISGTFLTDNPWTPGTEIPYSGTVYATPDVDTWKLTINFPIGGNPSTTFPMIYDIAVVRPAGDAPGKLTWDLSTARTTAGSGYLTAPTWNSSSQTVVLTLGMAEQTLITNPATAKVYRWLTEENTTIDQTGVFNRVAGTQAVVIK